MTDGIAGTGIKLGTTLYSMTSEFAAGLYTPETLIAAVAESAPTTRCRDEPRTAKQMTGNTIV